MSPEEAYARAPSIVREIGEIAEMSNRRSYPGVLPRQFWLRKAALVDRIALNEAATYAPAVAAPAVRAAEAAAEQLLAYDEEHGTRGSGSTSSSRSTDGHGPRGYVRQEYLVWSLTEGF